MENTTELVQISNARISVFAETVDEMKLAIKQLKIKKKEYNIQKRSITEEQKAVRAQYTDAIWKQGTMVRGGGAFGRLIRSVQTSSRDNRRANLANALAPLEQKKREIEAVVQAIDTLMIQLESKILNQQKANL